MCQCNTRNKAISIFNTLALPKKPRINFCCLDYRRVVKRKNPDNIKDFTNFKYSFWFFPKE